MTDAKERAKGTVGLTNLPPEVVLEHLLPVLADGDIARLSRTSKDMHAICASEPVSGIDTLSWSKRLYMGLSRPRPYLWGSEGNGRQGLPDEGSRRGAYAYHRGVRGVNRPKDATWQFERVRRRIEQEAADREAETGGQRTSGTGESWMAGVVDAARRAAGYGEHRMNAGAAQAPDAMMGIARSGGSGIVELQAGGWSFVARDMQGAIWVWGQMDGTGFNVGGQDWHNARHTVPEPTPIPLPCRAESMSVGRNHMLVLDEDNLIWEMRSLGRAYHHTAATLTSPTNPGSTRRPHHIIQVSAGWTHSACLTSSGRIVVWYPFSDAYRNSLTVDGELNGPPGVDDNRRSNQRRYLKWGTVGDVVHELPPLPDRPEWDEVKYPSPPGLQRTREEIEKEWVDHEDTKGWTDAKGAEEEIKVVTVASGADYIIALRRNGEVWYRRLGDSYNAAVEWEYLPCFSSPNVSHVSAGMGSITSYSTSRPSRVNHARLPLTVTQNTDRAGWGNTFYPDPLVELQGQDVIQVALGDYHTLALTARGEVYAWGEGDEGQLGLGQEGMRGAGVNVPRKVSFLIPPTRPDGYDEAEDRERRRREGGVSGEGVETKEGEGAKDGKEEEPFVFAIAAAGWHSGALVLGDPRRYNGQKGKTAAGTNSPTDEASGSQTPWDAARYASRPGDTGRMIFPEVQSPPFAAQHRQQQPFGGPSVFRVGLAGAGALPRQLTPKDDVIPGRGEGQAAAGTGRGPRSRSSPTGPSSGRVAETSTGTATRGTTGGLTGTIRNWVKRSTQSGTQENQATFASSTAAGPNPTPSSVNVTGDDADFRPLSGGYAEAAQNRPPTHGNDVPAFARGAGQSTYVPDALRGEPSNRVGSASSAAQDPVDRQPR